MTVKSSQWLNRPRLVEKIKRFHDHLKKMMVKLEHFIGVLN